MKKLKYFTIIIVLYCTTGCLLGEAGKGYLTKTCEFAYEVSNVRKQEEITITHKDNKIVSIVTKYMYENNGNKHAFQSYKDSSLSQITYLKAESGVIIKDIIDNDRQYGVEYTFDFENISDKVKSLYQFEKEYHLQLRKLENKGYICK